MRSSRIILRFALFAVLLAFVLLVALLLLPSPVSKMPPLPFDASGYLASTNYDLFPTHLPPHPNLRDMRNVAWFKLWKALGHSEHDPAGWSFGATPVRTEMIQVLLNQCMQASGVRYLMPPELASGSVQFGNSNALSGRQWIASVESTLETNKPGWWDYKMKRRYHENLVLIRYPEQKTVLVLPASLALEFRRTNSSGVMDQILH